MYSLGLLDGCIGMFDVSIKVNFYISPVCGLWCMVDKSTTDDVDFSMYDDMDEMMSDIQENEEEWRKLMPEKTRSLPVRVAVIGIQLLILLGVASPAIVFLLVGFQAAIVAWLVMMLFIMVQIV